jgi:hypothetical protein
MFCTLSFVQISKEEVDTLLYDKLDKAAITTVSGLC